VSESQTTILFAILALLSFPVRADDGVIIGKCTHNYEGKCVQDFMAHDEKYGPPAPFVDLRPCFDGTAAIEPSGYAVAIGLFVDNAGTCDVLIGDGARASSEHPNYFFNIGNHICGDIRTGKRLPCPKQ
jgi:hypothetical protein